MRDSTSKIEIKFIFYVLSILLIYFLLFIIYLVVDNSLIFPNPNLIIIRFFKILGEGISYKIILNTFVTLLIVTCCSLLIGFILGIISGSNKYIELLLKPIMRLFSTIPLIGLILIIMVIVGLKQSSYYVSSLMLIPIFYNGFLTGTKSISKDYLDVYRLDSNLSAKVIFKVYLPLIITNIKQALTDALGLGIKIVVMCEFMCGIPNTLGGKLISLGNSLDYEGLYAYCFLLIIIVAIIEIIPTIIFKFFNYIKQMKKLPKIR